MDILNSIAIDLCEFIDFFCLKYKYDHRGILKKFRLKSGLNKQLNDETWYCLFLQKSAFNYCAKFLLIKLMEDNDKIACKLNNDGLKKWNSLVSNISGQYGRLYELAELDLLEAEDIKSAFKQSDYDIYQIDDELAAFFIERLRKYEFKSYTHEMIYQIFNRLYTDEKRVGLNLQYFYKPANAIDYMLSLNKQKENLV